MNPSGLKALYTKATGGSAESSKQMGCIEVSQKIRGIPDTNRLILDKPSTPSKGRTDLISLSTFYPLSTGKCQEAKVKW